GRQTRSKGPAGFVYGLQLLEVRRAQGRLTEVEHFVPMWQAAAARYADAPFLRAALALLLYDLGRANHARSELEQLAPFGRLPRDLTWLMALAQAAEVCAACDQTQHATALYALLLPYERRNAISAFTAVCWGSVARTLGLLATTRRQWSTAEAHFEAALERN